ncbi:MAG: kelch repeat-containing protein [Deltaproteobacteria bacterium]|nr:kelch repeat-containing protein [Deltaproteobacteria bacterium]
MKMALQPIRLIFLLGLGSCATRAAAPVTPAEVPLVPAAAWEVVPTTGPAQERHECSFVQSGGKFYLLGGRGDRAVNVLDPKTGQWTRGAAAPQELHHFQAVAFAGKLVVAGALTGGYPAERPVPNLFIYDPAVDQWTRGPEIPQGRRRGAAGLVAYKDSLWLLGGLTEGHNGGFVPWFDAFDPKTERWQIMPDAPRPRDHFGAVVVDDQLVAAGGRTSSARTNQVLELTIAEVDVFDFASGQWRTLPVPQAALPTLRAGTLAVPLDHGVVVLGGESAGQELAHNEVQALDLRAGTWRSLPALNKGRHGTGAAWLGNTLYVAAGSAHKGGGPETIDVERLLFTR